MPILRRSLLMAAAAVTLACRRAVCAPRDTRQNVLLAGVYGEHIDPRRYLVSEKYDGVRALWDGRGLRFRSGRAVAAPAWFTAALPAQPLDGELWLARGRFDVLSAIVRSASAGDAAWRQVRYMVFELPGAEGDFARRAQRIRELAQQLAWPPLEAAPQRTVADRQELRACLAEVVAGGGEGLALHLASASYVTGRSDVLVKLKPHLDTEATVVAHLPGQGKYAGQVGALWVRTPEGREFAIGSGLTDALRRQPPQPGTVITYRYRDLTASGLPRFASFMRVHDAA